MLAVGIIDAQNSFMIPGNELYVPGAEKIIRRLNYLKEWVRNTQQANGNLSIPLFFTQDNHLPEDVELKTNGGAYPPHCMAGTFGQANVMEVPTDGGTVFKKRCYDIWDDKLGMPKELEAYLKSYCWGLSLTGDYPKIDKAILAGVVGNICVAACARGLRKRGIDVDIIEDSVVWLDISADNNEVVCRRELIELGVKFIPSIDGYKL